MLKEEIFVAIKNRQIQGFKGIQLHRRKIGQEVEFVTIMLFDSLDSIREFAGEDYEIAVVPEKARAVLSRKIRDSSNGLSLKERRKASFNAVVKRGSYLSN